MKKMLCLWLLLVTFIVPSTEAATKDKDIDARTFVASSINYISIDYSTVAKELNNIEEVLKSGSVQNSTVSQYVSYLGTTRSQLLESKKQLEEELKNANRRIDSLGEIPKEGEEELQVIAEKRKEYNEEAVYQKGRVAETDILINKIDELTTLIMAVRKQALIGNLLVYQEPMIYPSIFLKATGQLLDFSFNIIKSPIGWYKDLNDGQKNTVKSNMLGVLLAILVALVVGYMLRRLIIMHLGYKKNVTEVPPYFTKVMAAFFVACAYGVIPAVLLGGFLLWIIHTKILAIGFFGLVLASVLYYSLSVFLANAVIRVVFAPYNSMWRLINMDDSKAKRVTKAFYFSFSVIGISSFLLHIASEANYTLELIYYLSLVSVAIKSFCLVLLVKRLFWEDTMLPDAVEGEERTIDDEDFADEGARTAFRVVFLTVLFSIAVVGISLFGYPRLAEFIINRLLISMLVVGVFVIVRRAVFELLKRILLFNFWVKTFRVRRQLIEKIDFWLGVVINPIFVVLAVLTLLSLWGVSTDLLLQSMKKILLGFKVGGVEISLLSILMGIGVFFISISLVKLLRRKLFDNILSHVEMDDGIRHSLASGFGFVGFVLAIILAIAVMGGDLSNLALVAGALSVGIGLGLQSIVNNFVSGIVLLFERPVKVGDWVIINGEEGKIKQVNIRSTEIETFNKASVIIPNATLLSTSVTNLTHSNNWSRQSMMVGVAYGSDPQKVTDVLMECARANKKVLKNPPPYVIFKNFGPSSLDFEVRCYTSDIWSGWSIPSDLRYEICRRFKEEGIEIPFPQMVVHRGDKTQQVVKVEEIPTPVKAVSEKAVLRKKAKTSASKNESKKNAD